MPPSSPFGDLSASTFAELQERADRFAESVQAGPVSDWSAYLGDTQEPLRTPLLVELIKIDLEVGWRRGENPQVEDYLKRFPELGTANTIPAHLIFEEYRTRTRFGDRPELANYRDRFPQQYSQLMELAREPVSWAGASPTAFSESMESSKLGATNLEAALTADGKAELKPADRSIDGKSNATIVLAGGYELVRWLGSGQFGEVWRARGPGGVEVAVKVVRIAEKQTKKGAAQRELAALELVKNLRHPFLLQTHAFWTEAQKLYIVMDLAEGSLRDRLEVCLEKTKLGIPTDELIPLMADAAEGLDFLHSRSVFHRDVKPDNLLMLHGHAKVADFGLAKSLDPGAAVSFAGTPAYMAPEAWRNEFTPASDQFSLAFTYAELRQGRRPVAGDNLVDLVRQLRDGEFDLKNMPPGEREVVMKAMSPNPTNRFASCTAFVAALAASVGVGTRRAAPVHYAKPDPANLSGTEIQPSIGDVIEWAGSFANLGGDGQGVSESAPKLIATNFGVSDSQPRLIETNFAPAVEAPPPPITQSDTESEEVSSDLPSTKTAPEPVPSRGVPKFVILLGVALLAAAGAGAVVLLGGKGSGSLPTTPTTTPDTGTKPPPTEPNTETKLGFPLPRAGFIPGPGPTQHVNGRDLHTVIRYPLPTGRPVDFRLIVPANPTVPPFYLMERKAWNRLYAAFQATTGRDVTSTGEPDFPVMNVRVSDAAECARWLGGRLPTPREWDIAAGLDRRDGRDGPTPRGASAAVGLPTPRSVFTDSDLSPQGIFDLGGNGREFTRAVLTPDGSERWLPLATPTDADRVILRGRMFTLRRPLTFADLEAEVTTPQTQFYNVPSPYTGFRIAIDIPAGR